VGHKITDRSASEFINYQIVIGDRNRTFQTLAGFGVMASRGKPAQLYVENR
jgi:hypothetical protein